MERIKQALERARAERAGQPAPVSSTPVSPAPTVTPVEQVTYSQTRHIEVSRPALREKRVVTGFDPCEFTDAYKMLRTQVIQRLNENHWNVLAITIPGTGEGKTLTVLNLAASLALEVDYTVLLVDANLRHPSMHEHLGLSGEPGLSDYLIEDTPLSELLVHPKEIDHLTILPGGRALLNSAEMLNSPKMSRLVEELKSRYAGRIVIFDLPPVLDAADAMAFSPYVDATLLVVEEGKTTKKEVERAVDMLSSTNILGTVLNKSGKDWRGTHYAPEFLRIPGKTLLAVAGFRFPVPQRQTPYGVDAVEYGLMNQAGFTVISGDIGTGKTTLIRKLLNDIDPSLKVGLISNTHQTFGDLLQWIALAYGLPHQGRDKVQLYQDFMDFIIQEYAQGRRTVLIVDEAQNMPAEALEELRMLSNVNADKDQVLQVILVGQRELRETLKRPDLVQFAQRIGVDYHLEPLDAEETSEYIRHRCKTAGGKAELFSDQACQLIHQYSGGVPRLINLLCDTALVYGYAEQRDRIDVALVEEVAKEKQKGGLFPIQNTAPESLKGSESLKFNDSDPFKPASITPVSATTEKSHQLRIAITEDSELLRIYLSRLLTRFGIEVVATLPLTARDLRALPAGSIDVLLVELDDNMDHLDEALYEILEEWQQPVLLNDNLVTEASLSQPDRLDYGRKLSRKLYSLAPQAPQSVA